MKTQIYTIGRAADNDIRIKDISISRKHAVLQVLNDGQVEISDCGSSNGTFVNGKRITSASIREEDRISFGSYQCSLSELLPPKSLGRAPSPAVPRRQNPLFPKVLGAFCVLALTLALYEAFPTNINTQNPGSSPREQLAQSLQERIERATVLVAVNVGQGFHQGSAFFIKPNILVTNRHVIENAREISIISKTLGSWHSARLMAVSQNPEQDYAVLETDVNSVFCLPLCPRVERGARVSSWGYPGFVISHELQAQEIPEVILTSGNVSAEQHINGVAYVLHTAQVAQGNSGGPLVKENGSVVGINTLVAPDKVLNSQFSIALPARDLIHFLRANHISFVEGE